ncbi:hypothetical protein Bbelb_121050 [Branchiostoma belcheri]|nr:hypothetical protein Bbelb_121050 [Branchiostoma belcheri]
MDICPAAVRRLQLHDLCNGDWEGKWRCHGIDESLRERCILMFLSCLGETCDDGQLLEDTAVKILYRCVLMFQSCLGETCDDRRLWSNADLKTLMREMSDEDLKNAVFLGDTEGAEEFSQSCLGETCDDGPDWGKPVMMGDFCPNKMQRGLMLSEPVDVKTQ